MQGTFIFAVDKGLRDSTVVMLLRIYDMRLSVVSSRIINTNIDVYVLKEIDNAMDEFSKIYSFDKNSCIVISDIPMRIGSENAHRNIKIW